MVVVVVAATMAMVGDEECSSRLSTSLSSRGKRVFPLSVRPGKRPKCLLNSERAKVTTLEVCVKDAQDIRSWCLNFPIWTCDSGQIGWLVSKTVGVWLRPLKMVCNTCMMMFTRET